MTKALDNKKDVLLLLLFAPGATKQFNEPVLGRTRLVKMLFLFCKETLKHFKKGTKITEDNFYEFFAWNFGPFSKQVYDDITFFVLRGFIESTISDDDILPEAAAEWQEWMKMSSPDSEDGGISEYDEEQFYLSPKGVKFATDLFNSLNTDQKQLLNSFKTKLNSTPLKAILKYVYETYPDFTSRSQIKNKVLGVK